MTHERRTENDRAGHSYEAISTLVLLLLLSSALLLAPLGTASGNSPHTGATSITPIGASLDRHAVAAESAGDAGISTTASESGSVSAIEIPTSGTFPEGLLYYAAITASNGQPVATEAPFDLSLSINCEEFSGIAPADLQNVEFFDSSGSVLSSWHQSGNCESFPAYADYWINLPDGIAANSNYTFYIGIASVGSNLMNDRTTGAAPTCYECTPTAPYGSYDDGGVVFPSYQSWVNLTAVPNGWTLTQDDGSLNFDFESTQTIVSWGSSTGSGVLENSTTSLTAVKQPFVWETYGAFDNPSNGVAGRDGLDNPSEILESWNGANNLGCQLSNGFTENFGTDTSGDHLYAIVVTNASQSDWASEVYEDGNPAGCSVSGQSVNSANGQGYFWTTAGNQASGPDTLVWSAIQTLPPNDVMPSVSVGTITSVPKPDSVEFTESGLPLTTNWSVMLNGATMNSTSSTITFAAANGTYGYSVNLVAGYVSSPSSGTVTVSGSSQAIPVMFTSVAQNTFPVAFSEVGLPLGTFWSVTLNGSTASSTGISITYTESNGTYPYSIGAVSGYTVAPRAGEVMVKGMSAVLSVTFSESGQIQASVYPEDAGVTVNGQTTSGSGGTYVWGLAPGLYYVNATLLGYSPYSNLVTVTAGQTVVVSIVLEPVTTFGFLVGAVTPADATVIANGVVVPVENGTFSVTLAPGTYFLSATAQGYVSFVTETNVSVGQTTHVSLSLTAAPTTVTFSGLVSPASGSIMVNGFVAYVNVTGYFHISVVPGTYTVSVFAPGYFPYSEALTISSNIWVDFILTAEPGSTSSITSGYATATGYDVTVTNLTTGIGSVTVTFSSQVNGTLLVSVPYVDVEGATLAQILSCRVYLDGVQYTNFTVTVTTSYTVILTVSGLSGDPTLFWALSPSATLPTPPSSSPHPGSSPNFLGLPNNLGYYLVAVIGIGVVAIAAVATNRLGRKPPAVPSSVMTPDVDSSSSNPGPAPNTIATPPEEGPDPLHDFF
jgi:PEGA domain